MANQKLKIKICAQSCFSKSSLTPSLHLPTKALWIKVDDFLALLPIST